MKLSFICFLFLIEVSEQQCKHYLLIAIIITGVGSEGGGGGGGGKLGMCPPPLFDGVGGNGMFVPHTFNPTFLFST